MAYIITIGFFSISEKIFSYHNNNSLLRRTVIFLIIIFLLLSVVPNLDDPLNETLSRMELRPAIADYEYRAAEWVKNKLPDTTVLISDYKTMLFLNSLGNKIWITGKGMYGETLSYESQETLKVIKYEIFNAESAEEAYHAIYSLPNLMHIQEKHYLDYKGVNQKELIFAIILSSRSVEWLKYEGIEDVNEAKFSKFVLNEVAEDIAHACVEGYPFQNVMNILKNTTYFELVYEDNNNIYIFKVKPKSEQQ